jgi:hypothetical protein
MIKKKAKGKTAKTKKKGAPRKPRAKKQVNPAEVRNDIAKIVKSGAKKIAKAVMVQATSGQLATVKYLFEVAGVYPPLTDGSQATTDEDCLARTLLNRLNIPDKPVGRDEEDEPVASPATGAAAGKDEKESDKLPGQQEGQEGSESEVDGEESKHDSVLV